MTKLIDYKSYEAEILKPIFQEKMIDPFIAHLVESFIYKEIIKYGRNGNIVEKYMTKYGIKDGLYEKWYGNGQKEKECNYKDGKIEGISHVWYSSMCLAENGQKWSETNYKEGKKDGLCQSWHKNGQKMCECTYKDGELDGLWQSWYKNGQMYIKCYYKDGKLEGIYQKWNKNGEKIKLVIY